MKKDKKLKSKSKKPLAISWAALSNFASPQQTQSIEIKPPELLPGIIPEWVKKEPSYMAMDDAISNMYAYANSYMFGQGFLGYQILAELAQKSEYRAPSETIAIEMTRKWIKLVSKGDGDVSEKLDRLESELTRFRIRDVLRTAIEHDNFYGRGQIYIHIKGQDDDDKRKLPLIIDKSTIKQGSIERFKNIEPMWTTPYRYNAIDPADKDFYKPTAWFVMGKEIHATRLLTIIAREVADMLKPAYNFSGLSISQLMKTDVEKYYRTRDSISDLVHSFSVSGIKTDLQSLLAGGSGEDEMKRAQLFNQIRDNRGLMLLDHELEDFFQFNTPLTGLAELQTQAKEQMAAPAHIPLVKMFGITPGGLNASSEGEIRVFYDHIAAQQENVLRDPLEKILKIIQLDCYGEIDESISFEFLPLMELTELEDAQLRKSDGDLAIELINAGVISQEEERTRLAASPNNGYSNIDVENVPEPLDFDDNDNLGKEDE